MPVFVDPDVPDPLVVGSGTYTVLVGGAPITVHNWNDIPKMYDDLVCFKPDCPITNAAHPNHSKIEHAYIDMLPTVFLSFLKGAVCQQPLA